MDALELLNCARIKEIFFLDLVQNKGEGSPKLFVKVPNHLFFIVNIQKPGGWGGGGVSPIEDIVQKNIFYATLSCYSGLAGGGLLSL